MASRTVPIRADRYAGPGCLALLALAVASLFPGPVLEGGVFFVQDVMVQNVPFRHFLHQALAEGRLPLWEPLINCGFPLFAEGQVGALYPPNWLAALLLPPAAAVTWSVLAHLWLAAAATWAFLRALGCGRLPALTGGLTYGLGGYLVVRAMSPNFVAAAALLPVLFWLLESGLARGRPLRIVLAGGVVALQLLTGHPQAALYGVLAAAAYGALRAWQLGRRQAALAALVALPGAAVAAVQLLPTWELAAESARGGGLGYEQFVSMSLPPERLLCLLLPDFFGNSATGSYWGREAGFFIQLCPYIGVAALVLALIAVREGESPVRGFFALLAVLGLVLSLGHFSGLFHALHEVPFLRQLRIPTRFLLWWAFAGAVLAGLGVDRLADRRPLRTSWTRVCAVLALAAGLATLVNGPVLWGEALLPPGRELLVERYRADLAADLRRLAPALIAVALLTAAPVRRRLGPRLAAAAMAALCLAELNDFGRPFNGVLPPQVYERVPAAARAVRADAARWRPGAGPGVPAAGLVRVASLVSERNSPYDWHGGWVHDRSSYERYPGTLRMYSAGLYGLANTLPGWSPLHPRRHWELTSAYPARLDLANAGYVISHRPLSTPALELVHAGQERVYRNLQALPRAWVVPGAVVEPDPRRRLERLRAPGFDPRQSTVLDRAPVAAPGSGAGYAPARITRYEATAVDVELPGRDGFLVLADSYAPGWEARVDGSGREILKANHVFRAVPVTAADRLVSFRYRPASLAAGSAIAAGAALLWLAGLWRSRRWRWPPAPETPGTIPPVHAAVQVAAIVLLYGLARETALWTQAVERMRLLAVLAG